MTTRGLAVGAILTVALFSEGMHAQAGPAKPPLSKEIRSVFEKEGASAAQTRYREIADRHADAYEFDSQGMMNVAAGYMQAGDMAAAQVFMGIASEMGRVEMRRLQQTQENDPVLARARVIIDSADRAERARQAAIPDELKTARGGRGVARTDLARFTGTYGDPAQQKVPRNYFIQACHGYLMVSAVWGDIAPNGIRSTGDLTFEQAWLGVGESRRVELRFHVDAAGKASAITHTFEVGKGPQRIPRLGPLPKELADACS